MGMRLILEQVRASYMKRAYGVEVPLDFGFRSGADPRIVGKFNDDVIALVQKMAKELYPLSDETVITQRNLIYRKYGRQVKDMVSDYSDHIDSKLIGNVDDFMSKVAASIVYGDPMEYESVIMWD